MFTQQLLALVSFWDCLLVDADVKPRTNGTVYMLSTAYRVALSGMNLAFVLKTAAFAYLLFHNRIHDQDSTGDAGGETWWVFGGRRQHDSGQPEDIVDESWIDCADCEC